MGRDAASSAPRALGQRLGQRQVLGPLDSAAHRHDPLGLRQVNGLLGFLERRLRRLTDGRRVDGDLQRPHRRRRGSARRLVRPKCPNLHRHQPRRLAEHSDVGRQLALIHRPRERDLALHLLDRRAVGDQRAVERGGQRGREVARLIGVRQHHPGRLDLGHQRSVRVDPAVGGVGVQRGAGDGDDLGDGGGRKVGRDAGDVSAGNADDHGGTGRQVLRGGDGFPRRAIELAAALLGDDEDHAITRASSRSFLTSVAAASDAEPASISVCFVFSGTYSDNTSSRGRHRRCRRDRRESPSSSTP